MHKTKYKCVREITFRTMEYRMDQQVCLVETPYGGFPPQDVGFYWTNFLVHTVFGRGSHNNTKRSKPNFKRSNFWWLKTYMNPCQKIEKVRVFFMQSWDSTSSFYFQNEILQSFYPSILRDFGTIYWIKYGIKYWKSTFVSYVGWDLNNVIYTSVPDNWMRSHNRFTTRGNYVLCHVEK